MLSHQKLKLEDLSSSTDLNTIISSRKPAQESINEPVDPAIIEFKTSELTTTHPATLRERVLSARLPIDDDVLETDLKKTLIIRDIHGFMKAGIATITARQSRTPFGVTREEFIRSSAEDLGRMYDEQQAIDAHVLQILNKGLALCDDEIAHESVRMVSERTDFQAVKKAELVHCFGDGPDPDVLRTVDRVEKSPRMQPLSLGVSHSELFTPSVTPPACSLTREQLESLTNLARMETLDGIILIVDDSPTVVKLVLNLMSFIIFPEPEQRPEHRSEHFSKATVGKNWQDVGIATEVIGRWGIVCAANARFAFDVVKNCPVVSVITDEEMPQMTGIELIKAIRQSEWMADETDPLSIALHTSLLATQLPNLDELNVQYLHKPGKQSDIADFLKINGFPHNVGKMGIELAN